MKKIPTLFERDWDGDRSRVLDVLVPECAWVLEGAGVATRKRDGTATLVEVGVLYRRYDAKQGRTPPADFRPAQDEPDAITGHWPGWVRVDRLAKQDWCYSLAVWPTEDGTYEFCGPRVGANPEHLDAYQFFRHGAEVLEAPRTFKELGPFFDAVPIEGIVWHHPDGRMAKIKARDFGRRWPRESP